MRILRAIVHPEPLLMTAGQIEIAEGGTVGAQRVGDYHQPGCEGLLPEQLAHEPQGGALIAPALNQYDLALVIDGTPQIRPLAGTTISSRCHRKLGRGRRSRSRRATTGPNFSTQRRTSHRRHRSRAR